MPSSMSTCQPLPPRSVSVGQKGPSALPDAAARTGDGAPARTEHQGPRRAVFVRARETEGPERWKMKRQKVKVKLRSESFGCLLARAARENKQILRRSLTVCLSIKQNGVRNRGLPAHLRTSRAGGDGANEDSRRVNLLGVKYLPLQHYRPY